MPGTHTPGLVAAPRRGLAAVATRGLAAAAFAGLATLAVAAPASAATVPCPTGTYPPGVACSTGLSLSTQLVPAAGGFSLHSTGWKPGATVTVQIHSTPVTLGTLVADSAGQADGSFTLPASVPAGQHTVTAGGASAAGPNQVLTAPLTVTGPVAAQAAAKALPFTGTEAGVAAVVGVVLVGAGSAAVVAGRRRRVVTA